MIPYGRQDITDDEIIGVKSTSIKFRKNPNLFLIICYSLFIIAIYIVGYFMNFSLIFYISMIIIIFHLFILQIYNLKYKDPKNCLKISPKRLLYYQEAHLTELL